MGISPSEIKAFHRFIGTRLENGGPEMTAADALRAFHAHQSDIERFKQHIAKSDGDSGKPLDADALKQRVKNRLAQHGGSES